MPPSTGVDSRPTVVFFTANPSSLVVLDLDGEIQEIQAELTAMDRDVFRFVHRPAATPADLQRILLDERPMVVQFSGHGRGRSDSGGHESRGSGTTRELTNDDRVDDHEPTGILLQGDEASESKVVSGEALGHLFSTIGRSIRLVFLNACHSLEQADALLEHVDFVVGIDGAVLDRAAKAFAVAFYRGLASGRTVRVAFDLGVNALMLEGLDLEVPRPVLRHRERADPKQFRLVDAPRTADGSLWDVFVSYAKQDREVTRQLARALRDEGIRVYFDEWEQRAGDFAAAGLSDAVDDSVHGLMAVSTTSMQDDWVRAHYNALLTKAVEDHRRLIPVIVGNSEVRLPAFLRGRREVDLRGKTGDDYQRDVQAIADAVLRPMR
jgi:TIR domain/CHAT domain